MQVFIMTYIFKVRLAFLPALNGVDVVMRLCGVMIKQQVNSIATISFSHYLRMLHSTSRRVNITVL